MPEGMSAEVAQMLSEEPSGDAQSAADAAAARRKDRWEEVVEIVEVLALAIVAIATAWSGYQAVRWDGQQSLLYGQANRDRFAADADSTRGGQVLLADATIFTAWLQAAAAGNPSLESALVRRLSPSYRIAFDAWVKLEPLQQAAVPGPASMPEYRNPLFEEAQRLNDSAEARFARGGAARETGDMYVRDTVLFASVLFLVAVAQRFKIRAVRLGANAVAFVLLAVAVGSVISLPRI